MLAPPPLSARPRCGSAADRGLAAAAACLVLVYLLVYRTAMGAHVAPLQNLTATLLATLPLAYAAWLARQQTAIDHRHLLLVLAGAAAMRLAIPWELLSGSDDAFRYLWDGRVSDHGFNPFSHPPQAPALQAVREERFYPGIFRPDMRTVYPPLAQLWFWVAYRLSPTSFFGLKLTLLAHELLSVALLWRLLDRRGQSPLWALLYAWSPLAVVQLFAGGHLDGLLTPWLLIAALLADGQRRGRLPPLGAGMALGASALIRPVTLLCLPALSLAHRGWRLLLPLLGLALITVALYLPYLDAGPGLVESLATYSRQWSFNGSVYQLARQLPLADDKVRLGLYTLVAAWSVVSALLPAASPGRMLSAIGGYYLLAPTVYPWYLLPVVALGALYPGPWIVALPAAVTLSDLVLHRHARGLPWTLPVWALIVEYGTIAALVGLAVLKHRRSFRSGPDDAGAPINLQRGESPP